MTVSNDIDNTIAGNLINVLIKSIFPFIQYAIDNAAAFFNYNISSYISDQYIFFFFFFFAIFQNYWIDILQILII